MDGQNQEDLKALFAKFFDAERTEGCGEDFRKAEQILREYPAPEPDDTLIANIKAEIAMRLGSRGAKRLRRLLCDVAGVAAAIVILATVSLQLFVEPDDPRGDGVYTASIMPTAVWEGDDIAADDADLAVFTAEIEQIENEVLTLQAGEQAGESESTLTELEMELAEINSDFWKG
jgi:hypothetical protein